MHTAEKVAALQIPSHARVVHLADADAGEARDRLKEALGKAGFSVLTEIDLADILRRRVDRIIEPHFILEVCRPEIAARALAVSPEASLLMPCKFAVWTEGKGAAVGLLPPGRLVEALGQAHLEAVAAETDRRLEEVLGHLRTPAPGVRPRPAPASEAITFTNEERANLGAALKQRVQALMVEDAGTSKRELQHQLAQDIDRLEALIRKIEGSASIAPGRSSGS